MIPEDRKLGACTGRGPRHTRRVGVVRVLAGSPENCYFCYGERIV
jgi:hypothetical protein